MNAKRSSVALIVSAIVWIGCGDDHAHGTDGRAGHTSPYPSCNEITTNCHQVDVGEGPIHDCHDLAHAAKSEADCAPRKQACLRICADARADAGITEHGDGGHS